MTRASAMSCRRSGISAQTVSSHNSPERSRTGCFNGGARDFSLVTVASTMVHSRERILARDLHQAVRDVCLWLPEAEEFVSHGAPNFRVRGKTFATYTVNHHGDGRVALWPMPSPARKSACAGRTQAFFRPALCRTARLVGSRARPGSGMAAGRGLGARGLRESGPGRAAIGSRKNASFQSSREEIIRQPNRPHEVAARRGGAEKSCAGHACGCRSRGKIVNSATLSGRPAKRPLPGRVTTAGASRCVFGWVWINRVC